MAQEALRCCFRLFETMHLIRPGAAWRPAFYAYVCVHVCALWFRVWVYLCELRPTGRVEETTVSSNQRGSSSQAAISEAVARNQHQRGSSSQAANSKRYRENSSRSVSPRVERRASTSIATCRPHAVHRQVFRLPSGHQGVLRRVYLRDASSFQQPFVRR